MFRFLFFTGGTMDIFETKVAPASGTQYQEVYQQSFDLYKKIKKKTKRRPYIRSAYFKKDKIFLELFWNHLHEKLNFRDKTRRAKYFPCALDLIRHTLHHPESKENVDRKSEILHRFTGRTKDGRLFCVQIKEEKRSAQKWLVSVFPLDK